MNRIRASKWPLSIGLGGHAIEMSDSSSVISSSFKVDCRMLTYASGSKQQHKSEGVGVRVWVRGCVWEGTEQSRASKGLATRNTTSLQMPNRFR
eukprot:7383498-Prymnesium_polylepis.2